jgi:predicted O-methyltransferase YrrM
MIEIIDYIPIERDNPNIMGKRPSAWGDIPTILKDIIKRFNVDTKKALEFGVEYGYSTSALANYFDEVIGVDTFVGDIHSSERSNFLELTKDYLQEYPNIKLIESTYQDFILNKKEQYDLIHIDIIHTYKETYECGEWAVNNSNVVIFHDTESFPDVKQACFDLATKYNLSFYNYLSSYGLGILVKQP